MKSKFIKRSSWLIALLLAFCLVFAGCEASDGTPDMTDAAQQTSNTRPAPSYSDSKSDDVEGTGSESEQTSTDVGAQKEAEKALGVPAYSGEAFVAINGNQPKFTDFEKKDTRAYEFYSDLDELGRCGYTQACVCKELMPTEERESISSVKPSGWINQKYETSLVDGGYLYNRCHLIGFQLTGENANKENLITGTRYMNVDGMLPFENMVADYVKETGNHVMYRVTPVFDGNDLVACGVIMEAYSVEDDGEGICFNVYVYNVQPGIVIDYATGKSRLASESEKITEAPSNDSNGGEEKDYILNTKSKKVHLPTCSSADDISAANRREYTGKLNDILSDGYTACGLCKPAA